MNENILAHVKRVHFIGIGGSGMSALAGILHREGFSLTGSDNNESDTLAQIRKLGIPVQMGHRPENIGNAEMVVYTAAVHEDNPEIQAARAKNLPLFSRAELLGLLSRHYADTFAVSGTHGKTTTTSMLTQILMMAGKDPTAVIGGKLPFIGGSSRIGATDLMVCEACEFQDSFLTLHPAVSVILNIDNDHLEYFKSMENLIEHFARFAAQTGNALIYNGDDANTLRAVRNASIHKITFGLDHANDYSADNIGVVDRHLTFDLLRGEQTMAHITLKVPGRHNILNALAACAAAAYAGVPDAVIEEGLNAFSGAGRRFEVLGRTANGTTVADDYAHHPTELSATLRAAKDLGYAAVWAVFQPFTFSRTAMLLDDFADALRIADKVVLSPIMGSREVNTYGIRSEDLAAKVPGSVCLPDFDAIAAYVSEHAGPHDLVLTLGCGDIYKAAKRMLRASA
ncbi:UDP-N-acetylmuramate--L-alanine ligase [Ethanoligenens harbinense]|uniref:UDP-N-acetylmuramate--L-alanine ligase n=1 Tax=Ethanoligenens harbinense (strain DSM 18485 / JCM 12961 / CGMCC 1.5033 / YUAN-3) TaxID=663278 RepID=E6U5Y5_ETHHY|nr:UDP-N-acetylmuramate--L-alanine ligase [Ethanoligenens harbinense]ADU28002.1 UDP-N-acetylmuramate/alanine ligase [Ethanoligenens harbinense YUAN-3]AVQ97022.1 UDP-N-acetylmuramate--L-alanine ligase [Ethanoligenens harbinense YUAN-3]AYF39683.1 UDP-N-acetylmuramate--L-alanine ligase [Ethanoligenens harbinense]AYF42514.1 UDP-N-acetylmuramate--L-alanine ligase [Ethanoligenens harbinense]QCN93264.1 UDP-N-acetylmuramate--L-alanine ligase [Ethanoligenens harbinense]